MAWGLLVPPQCPCVYMWAGRGTVYFRLFFWGTLLKRPWLDCHKHILMSTETQVLQDEVIFCCKSYYWKCDCVVGSVTQMYNSSNFLGCGTSTSSRQWWSVNVACCNFFSFSICLLQLPLHLLLPSQNSYQLILCGTVFFFFFTRCYSYCNTSSVGASQVPESGWSVGWWQDGRVVISHPIQRERGEKNSLPAHSFRETGIYWHKTRIGIRYQGCWMLCLLPHIVG